MAASTRKFVLFARTVHNKKVNLYPVAVFNQAQDAKVYATFLRLAHRAGDVDGAKKLDAGTVLTEDGALIPDTKWSVTELPYAPQPNLDDDETEDAVTSST